MRFFLISQHSLNERRDCDVAVDSALTLTYTGFTVDVTVDWVDVTSRVYSTSVNAFSRGLILV